MQHSEYSHTAAVQKIDLGQDTCENLAPNCISYFCFNITLRSQC